MANMCHSDTNCKYAKHKHEFGPIYERSLNWPGATDEMAQNEYLPFVRLERLFEFVFVRDYRFFGGGPFSVGVLRNCCEDAV